MNPRNLPSAIAEWTVLREHLLSEFPDIDPTTLRDTIDGETALMDLVAELLTDARRDEAFAAAIKGVMADNAERRDRFSQRAERRKDAAARILEAVGERRLERPEFTAFFAASPSRLVITDPAAIPADLMKPPVPDTAAVKARLRAGEEVPGAVLGNGGSHLTVRWS